jgi:tmRNA-binding protein
MNESDRHRMLLQAACTARLERRIHNKPFFVVALALYIENNGMVTRYIIFQRNGAHPSVRSLEFK